MLVGAQLAPEKDFSHYDRLIDLGVDHVSFCLEFVDPEWFARICPGKEKVLGQQIFFDSIEYCAKRMGKGAVSGEIIAGVEPIEQTLRGIDWIADHGRVPDGLHLPADDRRGHGELAVADATRTCGG